MKQDKPYPNLVIGGAPKCGTSSLFFWLAAHPEVMGSNKKETYFLADKVSRHNEGLNMIENGLESYVRCFPQYHGEKIVMEASPTYIYMDRPPGVLKDLPSKPSVIFILRKPSQRLYSHYKFNRFRLKNFDFSFEKYLDVCSNGLKWRNHIQDTRYIENLERWKSSLGKDRLLILQMEDLLNDRIEFMKKLAVKLGIDPDFYDDFGFLQRNESKAVRRKWMHKAGLKLQPLVPVKIQERIVPLYLKLNTGDAPTISDEEKEMMKRLDIEFEPWNQKLKSSFPEINLELWK
jgi:hypothetical protein